MEVCVGNVENKWEVGLQRKVLEEMGERKMNGSIERVRQIEGGKK